MLSYEEEEEEEELLSFCNLSLWPETIFKKCYLLFKMFFFALLQFRLSILDAYKGRKKTIRRNFFMGLFSHPRPFFVLLWGVRECIKVYGAPSSESSKKGIVEQHVVQRRDSRSQNASPMFELRPSPGKLKTFEDN